MDTIPTWGPTFTVSLDLYINSWGSRGSYDLVSDGPSEQVLRFTDSTGDNNEDQTEWWPGVWTQKRDGKVVLVVLLGQRAGENDRAETIEIQFKRWYKVELIQFEERDLVN